MNIESGREHVVTVVRTSLLYDGTLGAPARDVDIVIDGGLVSAISAAGGVEPSLYAPCVTPGLVNAHAHLELSGEPDAMTFAATSTRNQRLLRAVHNARASLEAGITTIRDVGSSHAIAQDVRDAVNAGAIPGPRIRAAGYVLCMTGGHGHFLGREVDGPWDARKAVREQLKAGADCIKTIATGGVLTRGAVPGNAQLTEDELRAAVDEAHRHGLRVAAYAIGTEGIKNALHAGVDSIEHGHMLDDEAIALFQARGTYLVPTLAAPACILAHAQGSGQPSYVLEKAALVNDAMRRTIRRAYDAGVRIAGGSDAGTPFNLHADYAYEVELMHTLLGMSPQQALHSATAVAAELIGLHRGIVAPGEPADMLLLDADLGADVRALRSPTVVIKSGEVAARR